MGTKTRKPRMMEPYTPTNSREGYAPGIYPCADCGGPVIRGYCCERCGSSNPKGHK